MPGEIIPESRATSVGISTRVFSDFVESKKYFADISRNAAVSGLLSSLVHPPSPATMVTSPVASQVLA